MHVLLKNHNFLNNMRKCWRKGLIQDMRIRIMHQCYYCEQIFDSKEDLVEHVEIHSDMERNKEIMGRKKQADKRNNTN